MAAVVVELFSLLNHRPSEIEFISLLQNFENFLIFFSTFFKYIFWISHMFSPLSWLYKESAFFIIKLRIWGIQILFVLDLRLRLNRVLKSQKSPEVRSSSSPIKILFPYSSAWIKYHLCILQICIMLIHELCPKGMKKSVQQTRSTFPLIVRTALNRPWNPGFEKKVGIFSFYLLRVSFSVRLNRIIILVERLMSLNGNLFSSLSFNRVWTIIPNPIHSFRIILFILLRASRTENHQNQRPQIRLWVMVGFQPGTVRQIGFGVVICGWRTFVFVFGYKCTYAFCVGLFIVLLLKSR